MNIVPNHVAGTWELVDERRPSFQECCEYDRETDGEISTTHPANGTTVHPLGWRMIGVLQANSGYPKALFAITFKD